jgi:signal transduction histidine kinase
MLKLYVEGFTKRCGIDTSIEVQPSDCPRLTPELETTIFRIVQEALTNVFRHSEARKATVSLQAVNGEISLKVLDDGKGMTDYSMKSRSTPVGVGLGGMLQRSFAGVARRKEALSGRYREENWAFALLHLARRE